MIFDSKSDFKFDEKREILNKLNSFCIFRSKNGATFTSKLKEV